MVATHLRLPVAGERFDQALSVRGVHLFPLFRFYAVRRPMALTRTRHESTLPLLRDRHAQIAASVPVTAFPNRDRKGASGLLVSLQALSLPTQKFADALGLALTGNKFPVVAERYQPSLAAEGAHLAHMIDVDQGAAMNSAKTAVLQTLFQHLQGLRRQVLLPRGQNPHQVALGVEGKDLVRA